MRTNRRRARARRNLCVRYLRAACGMRNPNITATLRILCARDMPEYVRLDIVRSAEEWAERNRPGRFRRTR